MYETHFGLRERPFRPTPDTTSYYPASTHELALARLSRGLRDGEGLMLLTGPPGMGKTLLAHQLIERLGPDCATAYLANSHCETSADLLQAILFEWSLPFSGRSTQEMRLALTDFLLTGFAAGRPALLIVDEAQHLPPMVLEELRLLANLEARGASALQVILVGHPGLLDGLRQPQLSALRQRLAVRCVLEPLDEAESTDYVLHHIRAAGGRPTALIGDEALEILTHGAQGIPRLLSQAAHLAFSLAYQANAREVDAEAVLEALSALGLSSDGPATDESLEDEAGPPPIGPSQGPTLRRA